MPGAADFTKQVMSATEYPTVALYRNYRPIYTLPASYPIPSPRVSCFAPRTLLHPTGTSNSALPLSLCPSTAPRVRVRVRAGSRPSARRGSADINKPTALPYRTAYEYRYLLYCTGPAPLAALQRCLF